MRIKFENIISFLKENQVEFEFSGEQHSDYKIASIFFPENNGFYFIEKQARSKQFSNSLFLTSEKEIVKNSNGNGSIKINERPQVIFYKLLNYYFKEKSNGKISDLSIIHSKAILGKNTQIDAFVVVGNCKIEDNVIIKSNSVIEDNTTIKTNVIIEANCTIGASGMAWVWDKNGERIRQPQLGGVLIEEDCLLGANSVIVRGSLNENTSIGKATVIAPGAKIGHGCQIGANVHLANNVTLGGNVIIKDYSFIGSGVIIRPKVKLFKETTVAAGAVVIKDTTKEGLTLIGVPAIEQDSKINASGVPHKFKPYE